jgi:enediyne biosynthesis protein E4
MHTHFTPLYITDLWIGDFNNDTHSDIVAVGNTYAQETLFGRYDASCGVVLEGDGKLNWLSIPPQRSGFIADGDVKFIKPVNTALGHSFIVTRNNETPIQFLLRNPFTSTALKK